MTIDLNGTDRQVRWATEIRRKALAECERICTEYARLRDNASTDELADRYREALRHTLDGVERLQAVDSASFWIDNRESTPRQLLAMALDGGV